MTIITNTEFLKSVKKETSVSNASILNDAHCLNCNWPIVSILCNDGMSTTPPYSNNDYWVYCSNKTCQNHEGGSFNQGDEPEFVVRTS